MENFEKKQPSRKGDWEEAGLTEEAWNELNGIVRFSSPKKFASTVRALRNKYRNDEKALLAIDRFDPDSWYRLYMERVQKALFEERDFSAAEKIKQELIEEIKRRYPSLDINTVKF